MSEGIRILVVEDNPEILTAFSNLFRVEGFEVWQASTGDDGLRQTLEKRPNVVLLDVVLPDLSGIELCKRIKADASLSDVFVVLFSGAATGADQRIRGLEAGADDYIARPLEWEELRARIRTITRLQHTAAALRVSEQRYRRLAECSPDAIFILDRDGIIQYVNRTVTKWLERPAGKLLGRSHAEFFPPETAQRQRESLRRAFESGELVRVEKRTPFPGGERKIETRMVPLRDKRGRVISVMGIARDLTEQQQTKEFIRDREALRRGIITAATDGFWMLDLAGKIVDVNEAYCRMTGYSRQELLSMHASKIEVRESGREEVNEHVRQIVRSHHHHFETQHRCKDGRILDLDVSASWLKRGNGCVFAFLRDITDRKRVEREFRVQHELTAFLSSTDDLQALLERLLSTALHAESIDSGGIYLVDQKTGAWTLAVHRAVSREFIKRVSHFPAGSPPARLLKTGGAVYWRRGRSLPGKLAQQLRREGLLASQIVPIRDGRRLHAVLAVSSHRFRDIPRLSRQFVETIAAQTGGAIARIRAEQLLQANRRLLETTFQNLTSAVLLVDVQSGIIQECNPAATRMFGYSRDEFIGRTPALLHVNTQMHARFKAHLHAIVTDKGFLREFEYPMRHKNGTVFPAELSVMPVRNETGRLATWMSVIRDITDRRQVEEELRQLPLRIIAAQEAERLRVARDLHDGVNQLIASAKIRLDNVQSRVRSLEPANREILSRSSDLLRDALEENRRIARNLRPSDLDQLGLVEACRNYCREFEARTNLRIQSRFAQFERRLPKATELNLFRILQEALNNIEKHAHAGAIRLRLTAHRERIRLVIQDDGRGIRARRTGKRPSAAPGIGFTNMRERAASLGGTCEIESASGKGTIVSVSIPTNTRDQGRVSSIERRRHASGREPRGGQPSKPSSARSFRPR
jgi:PAS domain S-box-containing protein